ncbi:MAG: hypothetical protein WAL42_07705 [Nitrososphaeraceae archaeon]
MVMIWAITRIPGNHIKGRGGPISEMAIAVEIFQIAYVVITIIIIIKEGHGQKISSKEKID